jgi:hypothetical protein
MIMEDFDELCRLYQEWRKRNRDYALQAARFVSQFTAELAKQIAAPDVFKVPEENEEVPYVRPLKFNPETNSFDALGLNETLVWDDGDGLWHAGIGIHVEPGRRSFPKTEFTIRLQFKLRDGDCDLQIPPEGAFQINIHDPSGWKPAIEHTVRALVSTFKLKPWEAYEQKKRIGFAWGQDKAWM